MRQIERVVAAALAGVVVSSAAAQDAVQWRVEDGGNGHWYAVHTDPDTGSGGVCWADALSRARSVGGDLISLASPEENQFVLATLATFEDCGCYSLLGWIGLVGDGTWSDGEIVEWTNWENGGPSGDGPHATMPFPELNGTWNDIGGTDGCHASGCCPLNRWVVEWSADCNGDGIVDYGQILDGTFADADGNGVPDCCDADEACDPCIGDLNGDGVVGPPDLGILLAVWGTDGAPNGADINGDGTVNASDLGPLLGAWGVCP
ncbi:hypothetical protein OAG01_01425 [bacterium]|nr:hypothetical protein [bacterium]MDB4633082.1 hypothetical protein [bacterium]